jgi:hypothetical protein
MIIHTATIDLNPINDGRVMIMNRGWFQSWLNPSIVPSASSGNYLSCLEDRDQLCIKNRSTSSKCFFCRKDPCEGVGVECLSCSDRSRMHFAYSGSNADFLYSLAFRSLFGLDTQNLHSGYYDISISHQSDAILLSQIRLRGYSRRVVIRISQLS